MSEKMKQCKGCGAELYKGAKVCPKCGKKQGGKGKFVILAIIVIIIIAAVAGGGSDDTSSTQSADKKAAEITYTSYDLATMLDELENNAMVAEDTYTDAYVEVSGVISVIDSDGSYIAIEPDNGEFYIINMTCNFQNDDQREVVKQKGKGDTVTVKGQITSVGELLGYDLDIDSIE